MDIESIKEFYLIAQHGNLSSAAKELHLSQPVLSRHLAEIEADVGVELLDRSSFPMRLARLGEVYLERAMSVYHEYDRLKAELRSLKSAAFETILIGGMIESAACCLWDAERKLKSLHEEWAVRRVSYERHKPLHLLRTHELDIAFEPLSDLLDMRGVLTLPICRERMAVVVERGDPLSCKEPEGCDLFDIANRMVVTRLSNDDFCFRMHVFAAAKRVGMYGDYPIKTVAASSDSFQDVLLAGLENKVVLLPETTALALCGMFGSRYIAIPLTQEEAALDIRAFYAEDARGEVLEFIGCLR